MNGGVPGASITFEPGLWYARALMHTFFPKYTLSRTHAGMRMYLHVCVYTHPRGRRRREKDDCNDFSSC